MKFKHLKKCLKVYAGLKWSTPLENTLAQLALLALRVGASLMIMTHGYSKISKYSSLSESFPDPIGLGSQLSLIGVIGAEFFAAGFLILGLFTRLAALSLTFTMSVIIFVFHAGDPFNKIELALLYGLVFLFFMIRGPNKWSLDHLIARYL